MRRQAGVWRRGAWLVATLSLSAWAEEAPGDEARSAPAADAPRASALLAPEEAPAALPEAVPASGAASALPAGLPQEEFSETVDVVGRPAPRYGGQEAPGVTRSPVPLRDVPQSVQVLSRQTLEDQGAEDLLDVYGNVSGVTAYSHYNDFTARGFRSDTGNLLQDGMRGSSFAWHVPMALSSYERVEVLKGPASVLFGNAEPGATVNFVTKKPLAEPSYSGSFSAGSFNGYLLSLDAGGPVAGSQAVLYRVNAGFETADSFRDYIHHRTLMLAPVVSVAASSRTTLTLAGQYVHDDRAVGWDRGIVAPGGNLRAMPISQFLHEPDDYDRNRGGSLHATLEHRFSGDWRWTSQLRGALRTERNGYHQPSWGGPDEAGMLPREYRHFDDNDRTLATSHFLTGRVDTGPVVHHVLVGADAFFTDRDYLYQVARGEAGGVAPIDIYSPRYGASSPEDYAWTGDNTSLESSRSFAAYVQDQVDVLPWLKLMGGLRFDSYSAKSDWVDNATGQGYPEGPDRSTASALVPRAGVVVQPWAATSLFAGYSESFRPQYSNLPTAGGPFAPERGRQFEVGVKQALPGEQLHLTAAVYRIAKNNILVAGTAEQNPRCLPGADAECYTQAGEAVSRGVELDVTGTLRPGWSLTASYALNEARITEDSVAENVGQELANAPRHSAGLWTRYDFQEGVLRGVGVGLGGVHVGERATPEPDFRLPGYTLMNAALYYQRANMQLSLHVRNVLDTTHFLGAYGKVGVFPGAPRTAKLAVSARF